MSVAVPSLAHWPPPFDSGFGFATTPADNEPWSLSLWFLNPDTFIYGWAIPRLRNERVGWSIADVKDKNARLIKRVTLDGPFNVVLSLLRNLATGATLSSAAASTGLPLSESGIDGVRLGREPDLASLLTPLPWFFLPTQDDLGSPPHPRRSPNPDVCALGTSLVAREKHSLLKDRSQLETVFRLLEVETGLAFSGRDAERLGDLEIFTFPAAHRNERPRVRVVVESRAPKVLIEPPFSGLLIVRCQQHIRGLVLADEVTHVQSSGKSVAVEFSGTPDGPHLTDVEIWATAGSDPDVSGNAKVGLWFRKTFAFIRRVSIGMSLSSGTSTFDSDWLRRWANDRKKGTSVERMRKVTRAHEDRTMEVGEPDAPFVAVANDAFAFAAKLRPPRSQARLFPVGARLEFAEWLRTELGGNRISRVLLLDPYFDSWGVELFARVENTSPLFEVLTALDRGTPRDGTTEETVLLDLRRACENLGVMLDGVRFALRAIRGDKPFHDRLLLGFDEEDQVAKGFNLSNSLSGAAAKHPLLVTPIADDVLPHVADYLANLIQTDSSRVEVIREAFAPIKKVDSPVATDPRSVEELLGELTSVGDRTWSEVWPALALALANVPEPHHGLQTINDRVPGFAKWIAEWLAVNAPATPTPVGVANVPVRREQLSVLTPYAQSFAEVSRDVDRYFDFFERHDHVSWAVEFGFEFLIRYAPELFASTAHRIASGAPAVEAELQRRASSGALLQVITAKIVETLSLDPSVDLLRELLQQRTDFLRALAACAIGIAILREENEESLSLEKGVALLTALSPKEKVQAVAEWIGEIRVTGNRRGHTETKENAEIRRQLMKALISWWPEADSAFLDDVVNRLEGPIPGGWADSTTNDFLAPLTREQKVTDAQARSVWSRLLSERMSPTRARGSQFHASSDSPLTQVAAQLLARAPAEELEPFTRILTVARRNVAKPFARANYSQWLLARDSLLWLEAFMRLLARHSEKESAVQKTARGAVADLERLAPYLDEDGERQQDPSGLLGFLEAVRSMSAPDVPDEQVKMGPLIS